MKMAYFLAFLMLVAPIFADIGPGPAAPSLKVRLVRNGAPYTGDANVTFLCSLATERGPPPGAVEPGDFQLECSAGNCTNSGWYYKFNPCFASKGRLEAVADGKSAVSGEFSLASGGSYDFKLDLDTGALTNSSGGPVGPSPGQCLPAAVLGVVLAAAFISRL